MRLKIQLQFYLSHRGITAAELARKAKVSKQLLSLWLGGSEPRKLDQVRQVAQALGTTVDNLCFGDGLDKEAEKTTDLEALLGDGWVGGLFEVRLRRVKK